MIHKLTVVDNRKPPEDALPFPVRLEQHLGRLPNEVPNEAVGAYVFHCHNADEAIHLKGKLSQIFGEEAEVDIKWPDTRVELHELKALPAPKESHAHSPSDSH